MNLPNKLTMSRLLLLPFILILLYIDDIYAKYLALVLFAFSMFTDWIDGKIAKRYNQKTVFGSFWDPLSDKLMINTILITFVDIGLLPVWMILLNISREFAVHETRKMAKSEGLILVSEKSGKLKAGLQMLTILTGLLLISLSYSFPNSVFLVNWTNTIVFYVMLITLIVAYYAVIEFFYKNREYIFR